MVWAARFIERQNIDTFSLNNKEFEHNYRVDVTDPVGSFLPGMLRVGLDDSSLEKIAEITDDGNAWQCVFGLGGLS